MTALALKQEFFKCKRRHLWLMELIFGAFLLLYFSRDMLRMEKATGWLDVIYTYPILEAALLPVMIGALASRLCEAEHKGHTFQFLETRLPAGTIFDGKLLCGAGYLGVLFVLQTVMLTVLGLSFGFSQPIPWEKLTVMTLTCFAVSMTILVLQLGLSLLLENQLIALTVGVIGSFLGLFMLFFPPVLARFLPWGYYGVLMLARMDWNPEIRIIHYYWADFDWIGLGLLVLWFFILLIGFRTVFVRREV